MTMNDKTKKKIYKIRQVNHKKIKKKKNNNIYFSLINYEWHKDII